MSRRKQREEAMLLAYEMEIHKEEELSYLTSYFEKYEKSIEEYEYAYMVLKNMLANVEPIVKAIELGSAKWKLERILKLDLAILKIAITELFFVDDVPVKVSINEAVELSKKYSGEQSFKFVNGVLRNVSNSMESCAEKGILYLELLTDIVKKEAKKVSDEEARLKEIALIEKRLSEIKKAKEETANKNQGKPDEGEDIVFLDFD